MLRKLELGLVGALVATALGLTGCSDDDDKAQCGDGVMEGQESCDGSDLGTATCQSLGFTGGTLTCSSTCTQVTTGCTSAVCQNGQRETGEQCDGADLGNATCQSRGYDTGTLACTSTCTFDESDCANLCGNGTLDAGSETCDGTALGTATCVTQGFDAGTLACETDCSAFVTMGCCNDACTAGATSCNGNTLQVCESQASGCLGYTDTDCTASSQVCDDSGTTAICTSSCVSDCTTQGEYRCNANNIEICATNGACLNWAVDTQCGVAGVCVTLPTGTQCVPTGNGDTCATAMFVATSYDATGNDFAADFTGTQDWSSNTGCDTASGAEAIFLVWLNAGDRVHYAQYGDLDAVVRVIESCDPAAACLASDDYYEDRDYEATSDGFYYVVIEAYSATPNYPEYDLLVEVLPAEANCGDGVDNDQDGLTDCADPSCFGVSPHCATETHCGDGEDNDGDTFVDCLDSDCAAALPCQVRNGVWQLFDETDHADVAGCTISFTPSGLDYQWSATCPGLATLPNTPGGGSTSTVIPTASWLDDNFVPYTMTASWDFPFFGQPFGAFFIGSNGFVTFDAGDTSVNDTEFEFFAFPRIAPYDADLDPRDGSGQVIVDEYSDRVVVSFVDVMYYDATNPNTFQVVLHQNGNIEFHYLTLTYVDSVAIGLSNGASGTAPAQVDFVPPKAGDVIFTEIMFDPDVLTDANAEWFELHNRSASVANLGGCVLSHASSNFTIPAGVSIGAGEYLAVVRDPDPLVNGGITNALPWTGMVLGNSNTSPKDFGLTCQGTLIDGVDFGTTAVYPAGGAGVSIQLSGARLNATDNDNAASWCDADAAALYHTDNAGTPGAPNHVCGATVLTEAFETWPPAGWTIENLGGAATWEQCNACGYTLTGATGNYAMVDSDAAGGESFDDSLQSPSVDCTGYTTCTLGFVHYYNDYSVNDSATVEISIGGGAWTPLVTYTADTEAVESIPMTGAAGSSDVRVRFHYVSGYDWYWRLDTVSITCSM